MLEKINQIHVKSVESKKEYITALNIPIKEIGELMQATDSDKRLNSSVDDYRITTKAETEFHTHRDQPAALSHRNSTHSSPMKIPKVNLNEAKLRHILNELKRNER
jgi:hypothetical protein